MAEHKAFLERFGVARELQHLVNDLVSKQPEDPLSYIAKHFECLVTPARDPLATAVQLIQEIKPSCQASTRDAVVYRAFVLLSECNDERTVLAAGIQGLLYNKLLKELCSILEVDPLQGHSLMGILQLEEDKTVFYQTFHNGVTTCIAFKEYLKITEELFRLLQETLKVPAGSKNIWTKPAESAIAQLSAAFAQVSNASQSLQQAKRLLQPSQLAPLDDSTTTTTIQDSMMTLNDFKRLAAELFIDKLS